MAHCQNYALCLTDELGVYIARRMALAKIRAGWRRQIQISALPLSDLSVGTVSDRLWLNFHGACKVMGVYSVLPKAPPYRSGFRF